MPAGALARGLACGIVAVGMLLAAPGSSWAITCADSVATATLDGCPAGVALTEFPDHVGAVRVAATSDARSVSAVRWVGRGWRVVPVRSGSLRRAKPAALGGWSWTWARATGWLLMRQSQLRVGSVAIPAGRRTIELSGPWRADGRFVRDRFGRAVFFHGVNMVWKRKPYVPPSSLFGAPATQSYLDDRDARFLARNGLGSVRLGVMWAGTQPTPSRYDDGYINQMTAISRMFSQRDVSVVVDSHQDMYNEAYNGEGFPDWARLDLGTRPINVGTFPFNYMSPSQQSAWSDLWADRAGLADRFRAQWVHVASAFDGDRNIIGYDLLNEPWPNNSLACITVGCTSFESGAYQQFLEQTVEGIRTVDRSTPVWWESPVTTTLGGPNRVGMNAPLRDPASNSVLSFHSYCRFGGVTPLLSRTADPDCPGHHRHDFRTHFEAGVRNGSAPVLTEFGASDETVDIARVAQLADENMTSWHYWHYGRWSDPTGVPAQQGLFGDDLRRTTTLKQAKAAVLVRTYPQAVAGTPLGYSFSPQRADRIFMLSFTTDPSIAAETVVYVPVHRHYQDGYVVRTTGPIRIVSSSNAHLLRLVNTGPGTARVFVMRTSVT